MILFILLFGIVEEIRAEAFSVSLSPKSARLATTGVPFLHEEVDEALSLEDGLHLEPEKPFSWAKTGRDAEPFHLRVKVEGALYSHAILTIWNWHNHPIHQFRIESGKAIPLALSIKGFGVYQLTLDAYRGKACRKRLVRSVAVTPDLSAVRQTWEKDEFFLGVCAFPGRYHWSFRGEPTLPEGLAEKVAREIEAELLSRLGFQVIRVDESKEMGDRTLGSDGGYRFKFDRMDAAVEAYTSRGFELAFQLMNAPDWAISEKYADRKEHRWRFPRKEEPQRAYVRGLVERYGKNVRFVQIFNEPDQVEFWSGEPAEFVNQFDFSLDEIRAVYPEMPVINGGYSLVDLDKTRYFVDAFKGKIAFPAYHSHGDLPALREDFKAVEQMHRKAGYGNVRFLNTEMGFDGWRLDQERSKGQIVPQKTLFCWANNHAGVLLFGGRMTLGPARVTQDFGFLDHYFCPRYVYGSTASLVGTLNGASFSRVLREDEEMAVYEFKREEEIILAGYTLAESGKVRIDSDAEEVIGVDAMGNRDEIEATDSSLWGLDRYPTYLILRGATQWKVSD